MKIIADVDCDNAPKKKYVVDFTINAVKQKMDIIQDMLTDDFIYEIVGKSQFNDIKSLQAHFTETLGANIKKLHIKNVITHGKLCSINGEVVTEKFTIAFNDMHEFEGHSKQAKIHRITSYQIKLI